MVIYTIEIEGDFITFVGIAGTTEEGKKVSHRKQTVKKVITVTDDDFLLIVDIDNITSDYSYTEVIDPGTSVVFASLADFRNYLLAQLEL